MASGSRRAPQLVRVSGRLQAFPEELIRQRRTPDGQTEHLVRWCLVPTEDAAGSGGGASGGGASEVGSSGGGASGGGSAAAGVSGSSASSTETKAENVLMWMSSEDVYANCPALLGKRKDPQRPPQEQQEAREEERGGGAGGESFDEVELSDMKEDVRNLVLRARRQMAKSSPFSMATLHTFHVLSAYAAIGSLVTVFKETGALHLLMELLCSKDHSTRRSAGKMLRALASHDAGSRAYVLLSLSQQDSIEQLMDFENRFTLLELFAETSEEPSISFEGVHLPQIPGKLLFSLVKRYLRVTSLMDRLNTPEAEPASEWQDPGPTPSAGPAPSSSTVPAPSSSSPQQGEQLRLQREFEVSMAMAHLISELVRVMGWDRGGGASGSRASGRDEPRPLPRSIFQPRSSASPVLLPAAPAPPPPPPKKKAGFKTRTDFSSRSSYVDYVQEHLLSGMAVRMLEDYEEVSLGDTGEFRYSNDGSPPLQVFWTSLSRTYWVHWHMVEILGSSQSEKSSSPLPLPSATQTFFSRPLGGLYSLPYLEEQQEAQLLSRAEWWEVLFFLQRLEEEQQKEVQRILLQSLEEQEQEVSSGCLVGLSVPGDVAKKVLHLLKEKLPSSCRKDLLCSHSFTQHYLRRGGVSLEEEEQLLADSSSGGEGGEAGGGGQSSVSKKAKKELQTDAQTDPELLEELGLLPKDLEENIKAFNTEKVKSLPTLLEKMGEVVDILKRSSASSSSPPPPSSSSSSSPSSDQQVAAVLFIMRLLRVKGHQERNPYRTDEREKVVKALVELLSSSCRDVSLSSLRLTQSLLLRFDWRVSFATEGGVRAVLTRMQQFPTDTHIQQHGLAALKVITGAGKHDVVGGASCLPLSESGSQMMLEIFASIGSATPAGSQGLLGVIPDAIQLLLNTNGSMVWVRSGLLVLIMLVLDHQSLAEQLLSCDVLSVLRKCVSLPRAESTLAIIALNHLSTIHKGDHKGAGSELLDLQMLVVSLKELTATKEVIVTLEKLLCDENTELEEERSRVTRSRETFQDLVRLMETHRADQATQLSLLRILNLFLDQDQQDLLPWHETIETVLSSMTAFITDREVVQRGVRFLLRLAHLDRDYAVLLCRVGTRDFLQRAGEKHGGGVPLTSDLRDLLQDCDRHANLFKKMTTSVLAGCIQLILGQIEEHRRSHQPINIPFFDVFLRNLCQGTSVELKEEKCWEKMEVSSNSHRLNKLTDKHPKSYWESNGCTGTHWINIHMHKGVILRELAMLVSSEDSSYMPGRVLVLAGDDPAAINTELNMVNVPPSSSRVVLLENLTRSWNVFQIRIKRCQQGGIDTRVRGVEVLGPQPTFWPVFKEQLCCRTSLFYSTKARSWSQEVQEDRRSILLLYNKLNCALKHEQMFAERFLPDVEAAEALGKTCWEALITPIVRNITHSECGGASSLSWLLSEYLENGESARRLKSRAAIFNSRVRRLTHLLVHVDTSRGEEPDLTPPPRTYGKENKNKDPAPPPAAAAAAASSSSSSSSSSSARPKVKERSSSSIADIALCWQGVVQQQVRRFLQVSVLLPDLVSSYCLLFQRLKSATQELFGQQTSFLLALRDGFSSALLQLSVLRAMHVSERFSQYLDEMISGSVDGSSENLQRLHSFMESILFLSGLEITNTFEHFYRYYLGDRLLSRGSVWLEEVVMEQIGSLFPARLPQQMLQNLKESEELQQEFSLFRLQQQDQGLQDPHREMEEEWAESEEEWAESEEKEEEESEVQVLVLSPRCWNVSPLCYMEQPNRLLPLHLSSYLAHFTHFYSHSQSLLGLTHLQPRRLQWTWLGSCDVLMGRRTLNASTVQMFILLSFNQQEEVLVQDLLLGSGLCEEVLLHALQPLIAEGGPLSCSRPQDPLQGVLRVSEEALRWSQQEAQQQEVLRLLPPQTYLKVEEDAAATLERKRSFICCLIVSILKQDKEMHIDHLVFKVLEACQRREAGPAGRVGGVSCSTADVLSCLTQVISRGCARRHLDTPHLVHFLPDTPTTPLRGHAHFCFSSSHSEGGASVSPGPRRLDDGVLDAVLFSMGRTMSQEDVRQLMKRTVQQVSETLSVDEDETEHLLVHCRWNVDLVIQRYTDDPEGLVTAAGLRAGSSAPESSSSAPTCPVCLTPRPIGPETTPSLSCQHYCCRSCWEEYLSSRVEQNLVMNCNCPITDCQAQPTSSFFLSVLTDQDTVAKYEGALLRGFVESCSNLTWCSNPLGCDSILMKENMSSIGTCSCSWSSCFHCTFPQAHYPASCSHMSQWVDDGGFYEGMSLEAQSKHLAQLISKRCPSCLSQIEKNEGCLHMTCAKCHHGFCWRCLKPWKPTHKDFYNCAAMVSKAARQEKKFIDYNERCAFHYQAKDFALSLESRVSSLNESLQIKPLTFVIDACKTLAQSRKVLAFSSVYSFYNQETEKMDVVDQQTEALDQHTNALQILLEENLLQSSDLASCVRLLKPEHLNHGLELVHRIQERLLAILQHSTQDFRVGFQSREEEPESSEKSKYNLRSRKKKDGSKAEGDSGDSDTNVAGEAGGEAGEEEEDEYDEEYVPEWHEDYEDEDGDEDDFFSDDDESENLERDSPFD